MKYSFNSMLYLSFLTLPLIGCASDELNVENRNIDLAVVYASQDEPQQQTYYKPYDGYVGDPMPFFDPVAQDFKVLYLQEFRPNAANTYHPIWAVSTKDATNYTALGELIPTGSAQEQDAALGTGSTIYNEANQLYYTFYTAHSASLNGNPSTEAVMVATSSDFKHWTKNKTFMLRGQENGYSAQNFRDPFVFKGDDNLYHMLVATQQGTKGVIAEYVSSDLSQWQHQGRFMSMMWDRFYECPDVFKMGDWWYLVYSEMHAAVRRVQYFKGRTLDELKATTANDAGIWPDNHEGFLDSRAFYAGKTASDGTTRYIWGWCPTRVGRNNTEVGAYPNEPEWAGNLVAHRLIQHSDGTLSLGEIEAFKTRYNQLQELKIQAQSEQGVTVNNNNATLSGNAHILLNSLGYHNRISFTVTTQGDTDKFGVSFVRTTATNTYYSLVVNPEDASRRKINFEQEGTDGRGFIAGADGYVFAKPTDNTYNVTIYTDNSVCVMYINDVCCYTARIYGIPFNGWSINAYDGTINVSNIEISKY